MAFAARLVGTVADEGEGELGRFLGALQGWQGVGVERQGQLAALAAAGMGEEEVRREFGGRADNCRWR